MKNGRQQCMVRNACGLLVVASQQWHHQHAVDIDDSNSLELLHYITFINLVVLRLR